MFGGARGVVDSRVDVITVVEAAMERFGVLGHLHSDNGPEFIAYAA